MQRHRDNRVKTFIDRNGALHETRQSPRQRLHSGVFIKVNETAERAFVQPEAGRVIETP
jgi:hypothetical protein